MLKKNTYAASAEWGGKKNRKNEEKSVSAKREDQA